MVRLIRVWLEGYKSLKDSPNPLLQARGERLGKEVIEASPVLFPAKLLGPSRKARAEARRLSREIRLEMGGLSLGQRLAGWATLLLVSWTWLTSKLRLFQQPALLRIEHRIPPAHRRWKHKSTVMRLQGGLHARPLRVLAEDLARNARDLIAFVFPGSFGDSEEYSTSAATQPLAMEQDD